MAQTPPKPGAPKRFPQITLEQIAPEGQALAKEIIQISSVGLGGPYNIMFRSPVYADRMKKLLDYLRFFVLFEDDGTLVKKIAGYHQFHAVRSAIAQVIAASRADGAALPFRPRRLGEFSA